MLQLRQLSVLDLAHISVHHNVLPVEFLQFSEFTALTWLDLRPGFVFNWNSSAHEQLSSLNSLVDPGVLRWQRVGFGLQPY